MQNFENLLSLQKRLLNNIRGIFDKNSIEEKLIELQKNFQKK